MHCKRCKMMQEMPALKDVMAAFAVGWGGGLCLSPNSLCLALQHWKSHLTSEFPLAHLLYINNDLTVLLQNFFVNQRILYKWKLLEEEELDVPTIQLYSRRRAVLSAVEYKQRAMDLGKG